MPSVEVSFTAHTAHVRTARLIATAVARRVGVPEDLLDEVRLAVGEACSRAVGLHQRHAPAQPVLVRLTDEQDRFTIEVIDVGPPEDSPASVTLGSLDPERLAAPSDNADAANELLPPGFGLAVISGLVDDLQVSTAGHGTRVAMTWPAADVMAPDPETGF